MEDEPMQDDRNYMLSNSTVANCKCLADSVTIASTLLTGLLLESNAVLHCTLFETDKKGLFAIL